MTDKKPAKKIPNLAKLEYTLKDVRARFGTLVVDNVDLLRYAVPYRRSLVNRPYVIITTLHGSSGPQDKAHIDLVLTRHQAKKVYGRLEQYFLKK